jgi:transposase
MKAFMARLKPLLMRDGYTVPEVLGLFEEAGAATNARSLTHWAARVDTVGTVVSPDKQSGRPRLLDDSERRILFGHVLELLEKKVRVDRSTLQTFVLDTFNVEISVETIGRLVDEGGFSYRLANTRNPGRFEPDSVLFKLYGDCLANLRRNGVFSREFWVIDFTYNSNRNFKLWGYGVRGGEGPIVEEAAGLYTDCFTAFVSSYGSMIGPFVYTADPAFDTMAAGTKKRRNDARVAAHLRQTAGIAPNQIIYWGNRIANGKYYVAESTELVEHLIQNSGFAGEILLRDAGNCFSRDGVDLFAVEGRQIYIMPPAVHADMSPLDHGIWGPAKAQLRRCEIERADHVRRTLKFLELISATKAEDIEYYFRKNFITTSRRPTTAQIRDAMHGDHHELYSFHRQCRHEYQIATRATIETPPDCIYDLHSTFNGPYFD